MMVMVKFLSPVRVMGRHSDVDCSCNNTWNVSLYSCTVSLTMLMLSEPDNDPLWILTSVLSWDDKPVRPKSDPTSKTRNV